MRASMIQKLHDTRMPARINRLLKTAVVIVIPHYNRYLHSPSILQSTIRGVFSPIIFNNRPCSKVILADGGVALVTTTLACRAGQEVHTNTGSSP